MSKQDTCVECKHSQATTVGYQCVANVRGTSYPDLVTGRPVASVSNPVPCTIRRSIELKNSMFCPDFARK